MLPFAVRLAIDTPISLRNLLHLDAVLGAIGESGGVAYDYLPLARTAGLWHASAALLETTIFGAVETTWPRVKAIRDDVSSQLLRNLPRPQRTIGDMSPYRPTLRQYPSLRGVTAIWFAGEGDVEVINDLLNAVRSLGAMSNTGHGRILEREIFSGLPAQSGLLLQNGLPARTIPLARWDAAGRMRPPNAVISAQRWVGPYWTGAAEPCISPMQIDLTGTRSEIETLLGIQAIAPAAHF